MDEARAYYTEKPNTKRSGRDREAWRAAVHWGHKEWDMTGQLNNTHAKAMPVILNGCKTLGRFLAPLNGSFLSFKMGIIIFHS